MPVQVVAAVLGAALLHATWNALVKARAGTAAADPLSATLLVVLGGALASALLLPFTAAPAPTSWPFIAASCLTQCVYYLLLIEAYRHGDMSHAYPLMRGSAPLLVALANGPLTGETLLPAQWLAMCLICGGVLAMGLARTPAGGTAQRRSTRFALLTACVIALYTMIDGAGVRRSGAPAAYTMWIFLLTGLALTAWSARGRVRALAQAARARPLLLPVGGASTVASYGIALWAMTLAPVAAVAALRETSILFATGIAALFLRERVGPARLLAAVLIACGAALMRLA